MSGKEERFCGEDVPFLLAALISQKQDQGRHWSLWQLNICKQPSGLISADNLRAVPSAVARCVFVAFLLGFFPRVFIPFILRWS